MAETLMMPSAMQLFACDSPLMAMPDRVPHYAQGELVAFSQQAMEAAAETRYEVALQAFRAAYAEAPACITAELDSAVFEGEADLLCATWFHESSDWEENESDTLRDRLLQRRSWQALRSASQELLAAHSAME